METPLPILGHSELETHARRMRRLAVCLVGRDAAEDVVQDAWVSALSRPPRRAGPLGPWLAGVVRNAGRMWHRSERRRLRREARARPMDDHPEPPTIAARAEISERLARAVRALPEPYREVVVLRIYEGLPPRDVARRTGVPVETVRTRYRRALQRLRRHLDAEMPGGRPAWLPTVVAVWGLRPEAPGAAPAAALTLGTLAMKKSALLIGLVALAAVTAGVAVTIDGLDETGSGRANGDPTHAPSEHARVVANHGAGGPTLQGGAGARVPTAPAVGVSPTTSGATAAPVDLVRGSWLDAYRAGTSPVTVEGLILLDAEPVREGRVLIHRVGRERRAGPLDPDDEDVTVVPVDEQGLFRLEQVEAAPSSLLQIEIHIPGLKPRTVTSQVWDLVKERRFVRLGTAVIEGEIRDSNGRYVFGAQIDVTWGGELRNGVRATAKTRSRSDGTYRVEDLAGGPYEVFVVYPAEGEAESVTRRRVVYLPAGATTRLDIGGERHDPLLTGVVTTDAGPPVRGPGRLLLSPKDGGGETCAIDFDVRGRYRAPVRPGTYRLKILAPGWQPGDAQAVEEPLLVTASDLARDVTLRGLRLTGEVRDAGTGEIVQCARISWKRKGADHPAAFHSIEIENGEYVIDGLPPGRTYEVWALRRGRTWTRRFVIEVEAKPGETLRRVDLRSAGL